MIKHTITVNNKTITIKQTNWYTPKKISELNKQIGLRGYISPKNGMYGASIIDTVRHYNDCTYRVTETEE